MFPISPGPSSTDRGAPVDVTTSLQAAGLLIDLDRCAVAVHFDYFTDQLVFSDVNDVEHVGASHTLGNNKRTGYL